jgi:Zn-dependent protease/CBS domain-containing protein
MPPMGGSRSIQLARVFGIRVGVDTSWFIVLFLIIWLLSGSYGELFPREDGKAFALATASALLFFASVVLHELGHALVARRNGIGIAGIDLWLLGGLAKMTRDTQSAGEEFRVAAAGPAVTALIVAACYGAGMLFFGEAEFENALTFEDDSEPSAVAAVLAFLTWTNAFILAFNLLPGFPLDGGRIARAAAWRITGDRTRANRIAASLGRFFAYLIAAFGVSLILGVWPGIQPSLIEGVWLVLIGVFMAQAAGSIEYQTQVAERIAGLTVRDVMDAEPVVVPNETKLDRVLEEFFLRYRWPWFPVTDLRGRFIGLVSRDRVEEVPEALRPGSSVDEVVDRTAAGDFRVGIDEPLDALLGSDGLRRLGALVAVDDEGVVRGVITLDQVRRALQPAAPAT